MELLLQAADRLTGFDYLIISANVILAVFSPQIIQRFSGQRDREGTGRVSILRALSVVLLGLYVASILVDLDFGVCDADSATGCDPLRRISLSGLTLVFAYAGYIFLHYWILRRFGRSREIEGQSVFTLTYQAELLSLLAVTLVMVAGLVTLLGIWGVENWLRGTSVLGAVLLILFFSREVWLPDAINGLILLHSNEFEPGSVVRVEELDLLAVVLRTSLLETTFRDVVQRHTIVIPNARLRPNKIEVLSQGAAGGLRERQDFKIGYDHGHVEVEAMLNACWEKACQLEAAINPDIAPNIVIADHGDHAIVWRMFYSVRNVYRMLPAWYAIQRGAFEASREAGISLSTPLTFSGHAAIERAGSRQIDSDS